MLLEGSGVLIVGSVMFIGKVRVSGIDERGGVEEKIISAIVRSHTLRTT